MKLVSIVGARPQFIKVAPLARSFERHNLQGGEKIVDVMIHTGQHYHDDLSDIFFRELDLPKAAYNLGVGSGSHGAQTGRMLEKIEQALLEIRPDWVLIYGDTNSTVAGGLAASKLHIRVAHVESGLRSYNRRMPEEINRVVADHLSDLLFAPTASAMENLAKEGLSEKALLSGDIMFDALSHNASLAEKKSDILDRLALHAGGFGVVTVHRAENTDDPNRLENLLSALNALAENGLELIFPVHPRTAKEISSKFPTWSAHPRLRLIGPIGYLDMLRLVGQARVTLTDSGGLQKEAFFLGCPCVTLREETEWMETVWEGGNILTGIEPNKILKAVSVWEKKFPAGRGDFSEKRGVRFGDGHAADRIRDALLAFPT